jgi:hypothetical protein
MLRLAITTATLLADSRTLRRYGVHFVHKVSFAQSGSASRISSGVDVPGAFAHAELEDSVTKLEQDLLQWSAQAPTASLDARTHVGSMALWHTCNILLRRELQDHPRDDPEIQASARNVLELCLEAGDKIEIMNWVCP